MHHHIQTKKEHVRHLCMSVLTRLENQKMIVFPVTKRQEIVDEFFALVRAHILTEEDVRERTIEKLGSNVDALNDTGFSESDQFRTAKAMVKENLGDDVLNGFYYQKPLKHIAQMICHQLMKSSHIEDVFEADDIIERAIIDAIKRFNPSDIH